MLTNCIRQEHKETSLQDKLGINSATEGQAHNDSESSAGQHDSYALTLLRSVLDHVLDGIISIDQRGNIESFNLAAETIFGYSADEVLGRNVSMLMPEPYHSEHDGYIHNYLQTGQAQIIGIGREVRGQRRDGTSFPMELSVGEFSLDGQVHFTGVVRDISQRKKLEERLVQSQKMEAIGNLAGGVAHDFNNLLTVICGYSEVLLTNLPEGGRDWTSVLQIQQAGERASLLTRQLLAFSRQQVLEPRLMDLNAVVSEVEKMLSRLIGEDIQVSCRLSPDAHPIKADPGQVVQVVMNLAVNARDAMPQGGSLTIETSNHQVDPQVSRSMPDVQPGDYVLLIVSDTGCGMTPDVRTRIFDPFFTTKGPGKGTGLGLATVYGIIKQSGGHVDVYSEVGIGSTFKIYLPAAGAEQVSAPDSGLPEAKRGMETVLLVEDEEGVRAIAMLSLKSQGYLVLEAANGDQAMKVAAEYGREIDLLLTDVVMPGMSGPQLAQTLREQRQGIRVLFMSGYTDDAVVRHGLLDANAAFIQKPFTPSSLGQKVREILDSAPMLPDGTV